MSKSAFDELSQCILSYHDWLKLMVYGSLTKLQNFLTNKEHWHIIINVWSMAEHNSLDHNKEKWNEIFNLENPSNISKKYQTIFYV